MYVGKVKDVTDTENGVAAEDENQGPTLFGRNLQDIPCFRETFLTSIGGGLTLGICHFMFTSKVKRSTDVALCSFMGITLVKWIYCRYMWSVRKFHGEQLKYAIQMRQSYEGTDKEHEWDK